MSVSRPAPMAPGLVVFLLGLLLGLQPVATDLYLPALPSLVEGFGASISQGQLTLTVLLLCFGVSQLVLGPLSDRFGRRPVLVFGMAVFTLASIGNALAPSMGWLVLTRGVQGAAMGAAVVCARAIIRDLYTPAEGARVMARALGGLGVMAFASPLLGGSLTPLLGWRWAVASMALFGGLAWLLVATRFRESLAQPNLQALQGRSLVRNWATVARHPTFLVWSALVVASYGGLFTYLAASSFVFLKVYGLSRIGFGVAMASTSVSYILGTFWCRRLLARHGLQGAVQRGAVLTLAGGTAMGLLAWAGVHTWWAFLLPMHLYMFAHGVHQPCGQTGTVSPFPQMAGTASALSGFFLTLVAFAIGAWLGWRIDGTVFPLVHGVWLWSTVIAVLAWTVVQKHGAVSAPPTGVAAAI